MVVLASLSADILEAKFMMVVGWQSINNYILPFQLYVNLIQWYEHVFEARALLHEVYVL